MRVAILTISDSVARGEREDRSGPAVCEHCRKLGWTPAGIEVVPDEEEQIRAALIRLADSGNTDLILTTGGTGVGPRDVTPEATAAVASKLIPGLAEEMRRRGLLHTQRAMLSRSVAGVRGNVLILNLPGATKAAVESLEAVEQLLCHAADVVRGARHD